MTRFLFALMLGLALIAPSLASAQFSESYNFLKGVRDRDGVEVTKIISKPGSVVIDTHDSSTGEAALHIVTKDRDLEWLRFLLAKGAKPDIRDKNGETPLLIAARLDFDEGAELLLAYHASVDLGNAAGETPLIRAVQTHDEPLIRILLTMGADPNRPDHIAGLSARDYAARETRYPGLIKLLESSGVARPKHVQGPSL
jgi:hypothetical protein